MEIKTDIPEHLLILPSTYTPPEQIQTVQSDEPDVDSLKPEQRVVYDLCIEYLSGKRPDIRILSIQGFAGCLSGETPIRVARRKNSHTTRLYTLKELYHKLNGLPANRKKYEKRSGRKWNHSITSRTLSYKADKGYLASNLIHKVVFTGIKQTYTVTLANGKQIRATEDHRFLISDEPGTDIQCFKTLRELKLGDYVLCKSLRKAVGHKKKPIRPEIITKMPYYTSARNKTVWCNGIAYQYQRILRARAVYDAHINQVPFDTFISEVSNNLDHGYMFSSLDMEIHHLDENPTNDIPSNLRLMSKEDHSRLHGDKARLHFRDRDLSKILITSIEPFGSEETYDIQMEDPYNNFLANDIVVHNSGKTYVITQVMKYAVKYLKHNIAVTAPTNKAVKVLRKTANYEHNRIKYMTIHKLLGLKEDREDANGKLKFKKDWDQPSAIDEMNDLIVDETSMMQDDLFHMINEVVSYKTSTRGPMEEDWEHDDDISPEEDDLDEEGIDYLLSKTDGVTPIQGLKLIFLGDPIQIPPIGKSDCIPFNMNKAKLYGIHTVYLTEIVRQKEGNPILELSAIIRKYYKAVMVPYERVSHYTDQGSISVIAAADKDTLYHLCDVYFTNPHFAYDADFMKVVAWTNKVVDFMNRKIRGYIYKDMVTELKAYRSLGDELPELPKILVGEKLIANKPVIEDIGYKKFVLFNANDEFEVVSYKIVSKQIFQSYAVNVYKTVVKMVDYSTMKTVTKTIDILHEDSEDSFYKVLEIMVNNALATPLQERGRMWKAKFATEEKVADISYAYAITAHKAQGSTYDNCAVIIADIDHNYKVEERNRIKYVACTRAKTNLFIVE